MVQITKVVSVTVTNNDITSVNILYIYNKISSPKMKGTLRDTTILAGKKVTLNVPCAEFSNNLQDFSTTK